MYIFGRTSLIIVAISTPALTLGDAGFYYRPSHYSPHNPHRQGNPPDRSNVLGGAQLHVFDYKRPLVDTPTQAPPAYARPVYDTPTVHARPMYDPPAIYAPPVYAPPVYAPPVYAPPVVYTQPPYNSPTTTTPPTMHPPPVTTDQPYNPPAAYTSAYNSPAASSTFTRTSHTPSVYTPAPNPEDTPEDAHKDAHKDVPEDTPEDAQKETPEDAHKDTPEDAHKDTPEDAHKDTPEDSYKDTPEDAHKDAPEDSHKDSHKDTPEDTHKDVPEAPEDTYEEPTPPTRNHGKPSPLPNSVDRRNAPRVARTKISRNAKRALPRQGRTRRFPFLKKRQQPGQHTVAPVTVNMIPGAGHATSTSGALATTTANALPASPPPLAPGIKIDTSQDALSFYSNPESTMPSVEAPTPPGSSQLEGSHNTVLDAGGPALHTDKVTAIAWVLSIVIGLIVFITIVKLTSNAMRKRKHPAGLGKYEDHLSSKGLIPEMSDKGHFESHDVIITRPDGSEISPLSSSRSSSPSLRPHRRVVNPSPPPLPMPTFAPPPVPTSPLTMPYVKLLSPTANLAQQNLMQDRTSETSEIMSMSTTTTDISERPSDSDGEVVGRQLSHRRMRSAPGSVVWSARSSAATGKFTSGVSGSEGYWESINVCGSESAGRVACRSSRGRSVAMSVMW